MAKPLLAPMEGLLDNVLRDVLTPAGGYDLVVSELIRIGGTLLPLQTFSRLRISPGLGHGSRTRVGTPLTEQLVGSAPASLAEKAAQLVTLSPDRIDLDVDCPAGN